MRRAARERRATPERQVALTEVDDRRRPRGALSPPSLLNAAGIRGSGRDAATIADAFRRVRSVPFRRPL
jgi:hypothetical protein